MSILKKLKEQATELTTFGDSKEKMKGHGMNAVLDELGKYYKAFLEYDTYFDSLPDDIQKEVNKKIKKLKIY